MDRPRTVPKGGRHLRVLLASLIVVAAGAGGAYKVLSLEPAVPTVDRRDLLMTAVQRGDFLRDVRGLGVLESSSSIWIPAPRDARVKTILVDPGAQVEPDTVILELSDPALELDLLNAEAELRSREAELEVERLEYEDSLLVAKSERAKLELAYESARQQLAANRNLHDEGLLADIELRLSELEKDSAEKQLNAERERQERRENLARARITVYEQAANKAKSLYEFNLQQLEDLKVRANRSGTLVQYNDEMGEGVAVTTGQFLAKVSDPDDLHAELEIPEAQAQELITGSRVTVEILDSEIEGRVSRIEPIVIDGSVNVEVELIDDLPPGARPDLSVVGRIELEFLENVLYMGRPANAAPHSTMTLYRETANGQNAVRTKVQLGALSVRSAQVLSGLEEGDTVIISDMSQWLDSEEVQLK